MLECLTTIDEAPVISGRQLDQQPYLMATPDGVVDLRTGECTSGKPEHYIMRVCPTHWTGIDTPCPDFKNYLLTCMAEDQEMADFIGRLLGYGLIGDKDLAIWVIMYGPLSRNGKDTLMNILTHILGKMHITISVQMLVEQKFQRDSSQPTPDLMALRAQIPGTAEIKCENSITLEAPIIYARGTLVQTACDGSPGVANFSGGMTIQNGGLNVVSGDVAACGVSLVSHATEGVVAGPGTSKHPLYAKGFTEPSGKGHKITILQYALYATDSFNFQNADNYGYWQCDPPDIFNPWHPNPSATAIQLTNGDFRKFRELGNGDDFLVLSDPEIIEIPLGLSYESDL